MKKNKCITLFLRDITQYLIPDSLELIIKEIEEYKTDEIIIDIADVSIFHLGSTIISYLEEKGYFIIDSKDTIRSEILQLNRNIISNKDKTKNILVSELLENKNDIERFILSLNTNSLYKCLSSNIFPLAFISQALRPEIKWEFNDSLIDFGDYVAKRLYSNFGQKSYIKFLSIVQNQKELNLFTSQGIIKFLPSDCKEDEIYISKYNLKFSWETAYFDKVILPASFTNECIINNEVWKDTIVIALEEMVKKQENKKLSLTKVLEENSNGRNNL